MQWALQEEIARAIVAAVKLELTPEERRQSGDAHIPRPEAFELYLKARHAAELMAGQRRAIELFEKAIAIDPNYPLPLVGLARSYLNLAAMNLAPPSELWPLLRDALERALALDPKLPEAQGLMAGAIARHEWDWQRAEELYLRALELAPNAAEVHHGYAMSCLAPQGRFGEAFVQNSKARELDPLSPTFLRGYRWLLIYARRFEEAEQECRWLLASGQDPLYFRTLLAIALSGQGRFKEACAEFEAGGPNPEASDVNIAVMRAKLGEPASAEELLRRLQALTATRYVPALGMALLNMALGRMVEALSALEQACRNREYFMASAKVFFAFDQVRDHPRFQAILRELRLA